MESVWQVHYSFFSQDFEALRLLVHLVPKLEHFSHKNNILNLVWLSFRISLAPAIANDHRVLNWHEIIAVKLIICLIEVLVVNNLSLLALKRQLGVAVNLLSFK